MKSKASDKNRTKSLCTLSLASTPLVIALLLVWGVATSNAAWADNSVVDRVTLTVPTSCSMSGSIDPGDEHTTSIIPGTYVNNIGITNIKALCNDFEGFSIYAVGYTDNTEGNNKMIGANTNEEIITGTATSGDTSNWAMKLTSVAGPYAPIIDSPYSNYSAVPSRYTKVAHYTANSGSSATDQSTGSNLETTYAAYMSSVQASDTYTGQVKYLLTHPASIDSVSSAGLTLEFQTYPGSDMHFADGSTTNTMELRQVCESEPVSSDGYEFNTTINIDNDTHFEVEGVVYNDDYVPYNFTSMRVNTDYGMPIFSFYYGSTTGDYSPGDGFVYLPYPLVIPEYGINYETVGWYFGNANNPTSFVPTDAPTMTITGGSEAEDSDFLAWLGSNATASVSASVSVPTNCRLAVLSGEYEEPVGYKGAWDVPNSEGGLETTIFNSGEEELLAMMEEAGLGQTIPMYAYDGAVITYDGNGATAGTMSRQPISENEDVTLAAPNYYKSGYGFAGWSTSSSATPTNGATIYGPNETVNESVLSQSYDSSDNVTLYAVWVQSTGNMQGFSCSSLASNSITALTDTRDGNVYTVGKLADNNCWMMENLRLDGSATLSSTNTNNPAISSLGSSQTDWCTDDNAACINQSLINTDNLNNLSGSQPYYDAASDMYGPHYGYGTYYNWYAATAGNGTYSTTDQAAGDICPAGWHLPTGDTSGEFAALNTAVNSGATNTSAGLRAYPANFVYPGEWSVSGASDRAYYGYYWLRTATSSNYAYAISFYSDYVYPSNTTGKYVGQSIRCIQSGTRNISYNGNGATAGDLSTAQRTLTEGERFRLAAPNYYKSGYGFAGWSTSSSATPTNGATIYGPNEIVDESELGNSNDKVLYAVWVQSAGNMQSFNCSRLNNGDVTALTDTRDGNTYAVGKLADGNCWMMENLRLDGSATLNSSNTNNPAISNLGSSQTNWCYDDNAACTDQSLINTDNLNNLNGRQAYNYGTGPNYGYGVFYNWYAATAGNGTYVTTSGAVAGDICPAGWHLPSGGSSTGEFYALNNAANSGRTDDVAGLIGYPVNLVFSGWYDGERYIERANAVGTGAYWPRTASGMFAMNDGMNTHVAFDGSVAKYTAGAAVRCLKSGS